MLISCPDKQYKIQTEILGWGREVSQMRFKCSIQIKGLHENYFCYNNICRN